MLPPSLEIARAHIRALENDAHRTRTRATGPRRMRTLWTRRSR